MEVERGREVEVGAFDEVGRVVDDREARAADDVHWKQVLRIEKNEYKKCLFLIK